MSNEKLNKTSWEGEEGLFRKIFKLRMDYQVHKINISPRYEINRESEEGQKLAEYNTKYIKLFNSIYLFIPSSILTLWLATWRKEIIDLFGDSNFMKANWENIILWLCYLIFLPSAGFVWRRMLKLRKTKKELDNVFSKTS